MKEKMIRELIPLSQLYYKHSTVFYENWLSKIERANEAFKNKDNIPSNYPSNCVITYF